MKYLCLIYLDEKRLPEVDAEDCLEYDSELRASGHCLGGEALQLAQTATMVRVHDGHTSITDGPFAETKEQIGGFVLIEARDLDEAIQIAAKLPPGRIGCVEIRPILELREMVAASAAAGHAS